tara:strand:+ start:3883 stop:4863 length:981 start_codon:yes stop_codon:yes gene_type:complete
MNTQNLIIYIVLAAASLLFLILYLIAKNKILSVINENKKLNTKNLAQLENQRIIDSINSILDYSELNYQNLCNSIRISTNSSTVIFSEMNKHNGAFKAKYYSSSETLDLKSFLAEFNDDNTLAIITGSEGTAKICSLDDKSIFPTWFDKIKFNSVICLPIINRIETFGCIYLFFNNNENSIILDKKLQNAHLLIKLSQKIILQTKNNTNIFENSNIKNEIEFIENNNNLIPINLDDNTEVLEYKNKEISLSSSEYIIIKNVINKNGEILLYEEILRILWPNSEKVNKTAMRLHIHRLREKTNSISNDLDFIKTLRGKGIYIDKDLF